MKRGAEGLFFLPYLTGERTPHADPDAKGAWIGLSLRHGHEHLARSVIEGATFAMRDCLEIIKHMKIPVREIRLSGGGARSELWRQIQADVYGQKVVTINAEEGPAYGVALLAAAGTGAYKNVVEACSATIRVVGSTAVNKRDRKTYDRAYPVYGAAVSVAPERFSIDFGAGERMTPHPQRRSQAETARMHRLLLAKHEMNTLAAC